MDQRSCSGIVVTPADDVTAEQREQTAEWSIWDSSEGDEQFHVEYTDNHEERVLVIRGQALVSPDDGSAPLTIRAGDAVSFLRGLKCTW